MRECIEEGILQSYVDNELSPEMAKSVAVHLAACSACAEALDEITNEMAMFATAFEAEMALDVPTLHLRERLDAAIAERNAPAQITERKQSWSLTGWFASFTELFKVSPQRAIGFASLIAVVAFVAIFAAIRLNHGSNNAGQPPLVANNNKPTPTNPPVIPDPSPSPTESSKPDTGGNKGGSSPNKRQAPKKQSKPILVPQPDQLQQSDLAIKQAPPKPLPGEQNYLKAIDSLTTEIAASDATAMKPSLRVEYERNLAVIDQAIDSTRRVARHNPKDGDAVQFLYSSYQSKLDLLSTVAEQVRPTIATR
jgi:hypothetical protein